jgi:beta-galactosidase
MQLDYKRFHSHNVVEFQKEQINTLREISPEKFISHNMMGFFKEVNYFDLSRDLDFVSWDYYYNLNENKYGDKEGWLQGGAAHDLMRSLKGMNFWIMEFSAGPVGSEKFSRNLRPGEMRRLTYQCVAHGADAVLWFRWRTCRFGYEQFWHGLLQHDGKSNRRLQEASGVAKELHKLWNELNGSTVRSESAIIYSYEDRWAFDVQQNSPGFDYIKNLMMYYRAFKKNGLNVDFVKPGTDLSGYKLVVVPSNYIITPEIVESYKAFVANGGCVIITFRSGVKDENNIPYELTLPGLLGDLTGVIIEDYESIPEDICYKIISSQGQEYSAKAYADWIIPKSAVSCFNYGECGLEEYSAVTVNRYGKGMVYYVGTFVQDEDFYLNLLERMIGEADIHLQLLPPEGVEVATRSMGNIQYVFIINHNSETVEMKTSAGVELISGQHIVNTIVVKPGDVAVLRLNGH